MPPALRSGPSSALRGSRFNARVSQLTPPWRCYRHFSTSELLLLRVRAAHDEHVSHQPVDLRRSTFSPSRSPPSAGTGLQTRQKARSKTTDKSEFLVSEVSDYLDALARSLLKSGLSVAALHQPHTSHLWLWLRAATIRNPDISRRITKNLGPNPYGESDFQLWKALLSPDANPAQLLQHLLGPPRNSARTTNDQTVKELLSASNIIPLFILQNLAAKQTLNSASIAAILRYLRFLASREECLDARVSHLHSLPEGGVDAVRLPASCITVLEIFSNLAFHARHLWPVLSVQLATVFTQMLMRIGSETSDTEDIRSALTFCCNAFLHVLAWPSSREAFKNVAHQERAQAVVLKFMASYSTPLELNQHGFRAIAKMQLMLPKTDEEKRWAELKALSWPPWKEDKTGMDAAIGPDHGISRATRTLNQMRAAGYSDGPWDKVARLYAGWDTDHSPTIQYRFFLPSLKRYEQECHVWAARIRTTRTLREAWAGFLAYEDSAKDVHPMVCAAMLEKILRELGRQTDMQRDNAPLEHRIRIEEHDFDDEGNLLPGDTPQMSPPPPSAHLETYTRTEPPSVREFLLYMSANEVMLNQNSLAYLLDLAPDRQSGELLMNSGDGLSNAQGQLQLSFSAASKLSNPGLKQAVMRFMLRHPSLHEALPYVDSDAIKIDEWTLRSSHTATALSTLRQSDADIGIAEHLMASLAQTRGFAPLECDASDSPMTGLCLVDLTHGTASSMAEHQAQIDRIVAFDIASEITSFREQRRQPITPSQLRHFMLIAFNAGLAAQDILASPEANKELSSAANATLEGIRKQCLEILDTVIAPDQEKDMPRLLLVPGPRTLLAAARALASADAGEELTQLLAFMAKYWPELEVRMGAEHNGLAVFRRAVATVRDGAERTAGRREQKKMYKILEEMRWDGTS